MKNQRKVSFASSSLSSTPAFEQRNLPVLQTKCQNLSKPSKNVSDQTGLPPPMKPPNVPPPTPLHPITSNLTNQLRHREDAHKLKTNPDLLALSQMFEQMQAAGIQRPGDRRISQSMTDLPERNISHQHKPRKLEPLVVRDKIIIQEQNGPAGLHLAVNYTAGSWKDPLSKQVLFESEKIKETKMFDNKLN